MSRRWTLFTMVVLLAVLAACGGARVSPTTVPPTAEATRVPTPTPLPPTPTPKPTNTPTPTPVPPTPTPTFTPMPQTKVTFIPVEKAADIQDARLRMRVSITGEMEDLQPYKGKPVMEWMMEVTRNPPAKRLVMTGLMAQMMGGGQQEDNVLEFVQVGDQMWMKVGGTWMMVTSPEQRPGNPEEELRAYLGTFSPEEWKEVGHEKVAGFDTTHYHIEVDAEKVAAVPALGFFSAFLESLGKGANVEARPVRFVGDVYATDADVIMKASYSLSFQVTQDDKTMSVTETLEYEIEGVNLGLVIKPPQVEVPTAPIPLPEGAQLTMSMGKMQVYTVRDMALKDVLAFYEERLPQEGFTIEFKTVSPDQGGMWSISKDGKTYSLIVGTSSTNEVSITVQEE